MTNANKQVEISPGCALVGLVILVGSCIGVCVTPSHTPTTNQRSYKDEIQDGRDIFANRQFYNDIRIGEQLEEHTIMESGGNEISVTSINGHTIRVIQWTNRRGGTATLTVVDGIVAKKEQSGL